MVFVDNISDLEYYNSNPRWGCYGDAVFSPYDIMLQANGFIIASTVTVRVYVCDTAGTVIEDATANFDTFLSTFNISGTTYYFVNIRCDHYSAGMVSNRCFTLNVQVIDDTSGVTVFSKFTQKYILINPTVTFSTGVTSETDAGTFPLPDCVPGSNPANCNVNYIKLSWAFDCVDAFTGDFYQNGTVVTGVGNYPFVFTRHSWIQGKIKKIPKAIKRTVSINCRTQRTETTEKYLVTNGSIPFPIWKVDEIEGMLLSNHLYVNDIEYQSEGGTIFEQFGRPFNCQYAYKLTMPLNKCFAWQIFGCVPDCSALATFYAMSRPYSRVYDDNERLVATDADELKIYFESLPGSNTATILPFAMPCQVETLMKVNSNGVLPKYLYVDMISPAARVFARQLPNDSTDLSALCNGATNNNQVPVPDVQGGENIAINVQIPDVQGGENQDYNDYILDIQAQDVWTLSPNYTSAANHLGEVTLNISITATEGDISTPLSGATIATISGNGIPQTNRVIYGNTNPNLPAGSMLVITSTGDIVYTGDVTSIENEVILLELFMIRYNIYGTT